MNKVVLLTLIGTLALATGGCSFFSGFADSQEKLREETAQSNPLKTDSTQAQIETTEEDFADLELAKLETESLPEIAGLIPATDPDARVRSSVRGRNDPFSVVALNPRLKLKEDANKLKKESAKPASAIANQNRYGRYTQARPDRSYNNPEVSAPPEAFEPTLANNVVVSGMYEANGKIRLIVKAPEETSSRYVKVGDYLSNGQVLVKRVDRNRYSNPKVILEQSGMEVAKTIGEDATDGESISSLPPAPGHDWGTAISLRANQ
ncbi:MAG: hypothetical protein RLZZ04_3517 [Cyanobacteriota bacterium]|jgi:hypothetical protein